MDLTTVFDLNTLNFATPADGHALPGLLAFRYKHGWILINPAIPSRGRGGSALASHHGHISGGTTHGHFVSGGPGGHGASHQNFVVDKRSAKPLGQITAAATALKAAAGRDVTKQTSKAVQSSSAANRLAQKDPNFEHMHKVAAYENAKAAKMASMAEMHNLAAGHKGTAQQHLDLLTQHHDNQKFAGINKAAIAASKAANAASSPTHGTKEAHQAALDAHKLAIDSAPNQTFASYHAHEALKHQKKLDAFKSSEAQAVKINTQKTPEKLAYDKARKDAVSMSAVADGPTGTALAHKSAANFHYAAANKADQAGLPHEKQAHLAAAQIHEKKLTAIAAKTKTSGNPLAAHSPEKYAQAAKKAQQLTDAAGTDVQKLQDAKDAHYQAHYEALMIHHPTDPGFHSKMQDMIQKQIDTSLTLQQEKKAAAAAKPKPVIKVMSEPDPGKMTGNIANDSQKVLDYYHDAEAALSGPNDKKATDDLHKAQAAFLTTHGKTWKKSQAISPAQASPYAPAPEGGTPNAFPEAAAAGFTQPNFNESVNGSYHPKHQAAGVYKYTGGSYDSINSQLRNYGSTGGSNDSTIAKMDKQFAALPPLTQSIVTGRSMDSQGPFPSIPPGAKPGDVFIDRGFGSTSKNAQLWNSKPVKMEIRIPAGMKAMDLNHTTGSQVSSENEVLLPRGTAYKIISDTGTGSSRKIVVEVVSQNGKFPGA